MTDWTRPGGNQRSFREGAAEILPSRVASQKGARAPYSMLSATCGPVQRPKPETCSLHRNRSPVIR
jgi:hypothetical protein